MSETWDGKTWPPPRDTNMPAVLGRMWDRINELETEVRRLSSPQRDLIGPGPGMSPPEFNPEAESFERWAGRHGIKSTE